MDRQARSKQALGVQARGILLEAVAEVRRSIQMLVDSGSPKIPVKQQRLPAQAKAVRSKGLYRLLADRAHGISLAEAATEH